MSNYTLDGYVNANIQPQVLRISRRTGFFVHKGDVLFQIDPRPFQVAFEKAQEEFARPGPIKARPQRMLTAIRLWQEIESRLPKANWTMIYRPNWPLKLR